MKKSFMTIAILASLLVQPKSDALVNPPVLDAEIRILLVTAPGVTPSRIVAERQWLQLAWNSTIQTGPFPTTIRFMNSGLAMQMPDPLSGSIQDQIDDVNAFVGPPTPSIMTPGFRQLQGADVVIAFTPAIPGACGSVGDPDNHQWVGVNPSFSDAADGITDGLDRRGKDTVYIVLVSDESPCRVFPPTTAAHEFGHILGGGHYDPADNPGDTWLFPNSRAHSKVVITGPRVPPAPPPRERHYTTGANHLNSSCFINQSLPCLPIAQYSDANFGTADRRNADAFAKTARSVASYIEGFPFGDPDAGSGPLPMCSDGIDNDGDSLTDMQDPDCTDPSDNDESGPPPPPNPPGCSGSAYAPSNVTGVLTSTCLPPTSASGYLIRWQHQCASSVSFYQVFGSQPDGTGYFHVLDTTSQSASVGIEGSPGRIRVRSCTSSFSCSALSASSVLIFDIC